MVTIDMSDKKEKSEEKPNVDASNLPDEGGVEAELAEGENNEEDSE